MSAAPKEVSTDLPASCRPVIVILSVIASADVWKEDTAFVTLQRIPTNDSARIGYPRKDDSNLH